jgi:hypothetical protein
LARIVQTQADHFYLFGKGIFGPNPLKIAFGDICEIPKLILAHA